MLIPLFLLSIWRMEEARSESIGVGIHKGINREGIYV